MSTLTERNVISAITVIANGEVHVHRAAQVLRDDEVIAEKPALQVIQAGQDISKMELEPRVLSIINAAWSDEVIATGAAQVLGKVRTAYEREEQALKEHAERIAQMHLDVKTQRDAVAASMAELNAEHAHHAQRAEEVAALRQKVLDDRNALTEALRGSGAGADA